MKLDGERLFVGGMATLMFASLITLIFCAWAFLILPATRGPCGQDGGWLKTEDSVVYCNNGAFHKETLK